MSSTPKRLLLVEDEVIIGLDLREALELAHGLTVDLAHTLRAATELAANHSYDFAVLDLNLGMGENSVALGLQMSGSGAKVVFTSGYGPSEAPDIADFALVTKPFSTTEISDELGLATPPARAKGRAQKG